MIKARFLANYPDYRPINWPIKHPYWCSGVAGGDDGKEYSIIVAYADSVEELKANWPEAIGIDVFEENVTDYKFSERFAKPDWFTEETKVAPATNPDVGYFITVGESGIPVPNTLNRFNNTAG